MSLIEYSLLAASSLFVIVDPFAVIPAFIAMTPNDTPAERSRMAKIACLVVAGVLLPRATVPDDHVCRSGESSVQRDADCPFGDEQRGIDSNVQRRERTGIGERHRPDAEWRGYRHHSRQSSR